ncbi:hypothetical protein LCGC14_2282600 [marine sediment metagenome]|uniref:Uncharacterized protein n=1 Tax=marine sediment metagenome TaxID=412755 RepID=A0A0F9CU46_9ZZZZ
MTIKEKNLFLKMLHTQDTKYVLVAVITKGFYTPIFPIKDFLLESEDTHIKEEYNLIQESIPEISIELCGVNTIQKYFDGYKLLGFDMNIIQEVEIDGFIEKNDELKRKKKFIGGLRPVIKLKGNRE